VQHCRADADPYPHTHTAAVAGECTQDVATKASADSHRSIFFHLSFTVTARELERDAAEWRKGVEDSIATYLLGNCVMSIIVGSYREHATSLQLEAAFQFSTPQIKERVRSRLKKAIRKSLVENGLSTNLNLSSRIIGLDAGRRNASYENLRARTMDALRPEMWHLVLDCVPHERFSAAARPTSAAGSAPGPGGGRDGALSGVELRVDPRGGGRLAGPPSPPSAAVNASCDSAETVAPLCGPGASTCIRVAVKVNLSQSSIDGRGPGRGSLESCPSSHFAHADPYLASRVVDAVSLYLEESWMDHILWTADSGGAMELVCVASAPGLVGAQKTARDLRRAICQAFIGGPWTDKTILRLDVAPSSEEEFHFSRVDRVRQDSTFYLEVCCGVAGRPDIDLNCRVRHLGAKRTERWGRGPASRSQVQQGRHGPVDPALPEAASSQQLTQADTNFAEVVVQDAILLKMVVCVWGCVDPNRPA
jgi:hypothetical protein